jgi:hypothetical protein
MHHPHQNGTNRRRLPWVNMPAKIENNHDHHNAGRCECELDMWKDAFHTAQYNGNFRQQAMT